MHWHMNCTHQENNERHENHHELRPKDVEWINILQQFDIKCCRYNVVAQKCTILNLSLPCLVEATTCTSPETDECRLYPELCPRTSVCRCETKIWLYRMDFEQFLRKEIFILWLTACKVPLAMVFFIHQ